MYILVLGNRLFVCTLLASQYYFVAWTDFDCRHSESVSLDILHETAFNVCKFNVLSCMSYCCR